MYSKYHGKTGEKMTQKKWYFGIFALVLIALLGVGCSTGNSGSDDGDTTGQTAGTDGTAGAGGTAGGAGTGTGAGDTAGTGGTSGTAGTGDTTGTTGTTTPATPATPTTPTTPAAITLADIAGTWQNSFFFSGIFADETDTSTMTISADGTYQKFVIEEYAPKAKVTMPSDNCYAEKGTVSIDADGMLTINVTHTFEDEDTIVTDLSSVTWVAESKTRKYDIALQDGALYLEVFRRQGAGSGIKGTWIAKHASDGVDVKTELIIGDTPGANAVVKNEYYWSGSTWVLDELWSDTYDKYEYADGKLKLYRSGALEETHDITVTDTFLSLNGKFVKK